MRCFLKCLRFFIVASVVGTALALGVTGLLIGAAMLSAYISSVIGDHPAANGVIGITIFVMIISAIYTIVDYDNICKR